MLLQTANSSKVGGDADTGLAHVDWLLAVGLIGINLILFWRSLGGYFLADDFVHIAYLNRVFGGHPELLLQNFSSNWMQTEGTQFYRPFISLTLAFDWLFWGANAIGYHLTNILYQTASAIFLYFVVLRLAPLAMRTPNDPLTVGADPSAASGVRDAVPVAAPAAVPLRLCAFFAAALFSVFPLHAEVVSWVIGRVDSVCLAFYLLSFWLFLMALQDRKKTALVASLVAFAISLISKEMAVTLPPTLFLYCLCVNRQKAEAGIKWLASSVKAAFIQTWPFWLLLTLYLVVRTVSLGTISGGYTGSVGEGLTGSLFRRLFQDGTVARVFFPFDQEMFSPFDHARRYLKYLYLGSIAAVVARLFILKPTNGFLRSVVFAFGWLVLSLIPTYQVFNLTDNLQGSRFFYMSSAPLCLAFSLALLFPLSSANSTVAGIVKRISIALACLLVGCYGVIAYKNNLTWVHAAQEVRALRSALEAKVVGEPAGVKVILLNLPQRVGGAHELYNAAMLSVLMQKPLSRSDLYGRILTFEPATYGDSELINVSRLRRLLSSGHQFDVLRWDRKSLSLTPVKLALGSEQLSIKGTLLPHLPQDAFLSSPSFNMPALATDFVDVDLKAATSVDASGNPSPTKSFLFLSWATDAQPLFDTDRRLALPMVLDGRMHSYRFAVSQHKTWMDAGAITALRLDLPPGSRDIELGKTTLSAGANSIPELEADSASFREDPDGINQLIGNNASFIYDASRVSGAQSFVAEVSKPNSWFEHYSGQFRDQFLSDHELNRIPLLSPKGRFEINAGTFPLSGYYQVRLVCLNKQGQVVGYVSDPINLQVSLEQIKRAKSLQTGN